VTVPDLRQRDCRLVLGGRCGAPAAQAQQRKDRHLGHEDDWLLEDLYCEKAMILDAIGRQDEAMATFEAGLKRCPESTILKAGLEPLRRERIRSTFKVIPGGLR